MFPAASLLATLLLAFSVAANPILVGKSPVTLPFARRVNFTGIANIAVHDQQRAQALKNIDNIKAAGRLAKDAVVSFAVTNTAVTYTTSVGVGSPPTYYTLLIDTGSSNTWIGASKKYIVTSTSTKTANKVSVSYGSGSFSGTEYTDTVTLAPGLVITKQGLGVASTSSGFTDVDGILGVGPVILTQGTLSPATTTTIPTVTDNLYTQGTITANVLSAFYRPTTVQSTANGELTFGGTDSSKYTGALTYTPITTTSPAKYYWGINQSITYGSATGTSILASTAGIVDTGTTLILIATNALTKYKSATGATLDSTTGLLKLTSAKYAALKSLYFNIGSVSYELTPNAQIWPRSLNTYIGGTSGSIYLVVGDLGSNSGTGLDFINGYTFLERYYSVYDTTNKRVGFAATAYTSATTN